MSAHCKDPQRCSVCLGAPARTVSIVDGEVTIDGEGTGAAASDNDIPAHVQRARRSWKGRK